MNLFHESYHSEKFWGDVSLYVQEKTGYSSDFTSKYVLIGYISNKKVYMLTVC